LVHPDQVFTWWRIVQSVHGVGADHCSSRTPLIRSPTAESARASYSTEGTVVLVKCSQLLTMMVIES
jgi:hypothetical protein